MGRRTLVVPAVLLLVVAGVITMRPPFPPPPAPSPLAGDAAPPTVPVAAPRPNPAVGIERIAVATPATTSARPRSPATRGAGGRKKSALRDLVWHVRPRTDLPTVEDLLADPSDGDERASTATSR